MVGVTLQMFYFLYKASISSLWAGSRHSADRNRFSRLNWPARDRPPRWDLRALPNDDGPGPFLFLRTFKGRNRRHHWHMIFQKLSGHDNGHSMAEAAAILERLTSLGTRIQADPTTLFSPTDPMVFPPDLFIATIEGLDFENDVIVSGLLFSLSSYLCFNFHAMTEAHITDFWNLLISLSPRVNDFPLIYGLLESLVSLTQKCHSIHPDFLAFLADPAFTSPQLKPFILVALFDHLDGEYLRENSHTFISDVIDSFEFGGLSHKVTLLMIVAIFGLEILDYPGLFSVMWHFVHETSKTGDFCQMIAVLSQFQETAPEFFDAPNELLDGAISEAEHFEDLLPLIRLLPFFSRERFTAVFGKLFVFAGGIC
jgi:hypothetical protein